MMLFKTLEKVHLVLFQKFKENLMAYFLFGKNLITEK